MHLHANAAYTVVQVATNDLLILMAFTPTVAFLLGIGGINEYLLAFQIGNG